MPSMQRRGSHRDMKIISIQTNKPSTRKPKLFQSANMSKSQKTLRIRCTSSSMFQVVFPHPLMDSREGKELFILCFFFCELARQENDPKSKFSTTNFLFFFSYFPLLSSHFSSASCARANTTSSAGAATTSIPVTHTRREALCRASCQGNYHSDWENCAVSGGQESAIHRGEACALSCGKICDRAQEGAVCYQSANRENDNSSCQCAWPRSQSQLCMVIMKSTTT